MYKSTICLAALFLSACGSGSSSNTSDTTPSTPVGRITGSAFDSQVYNGLVDIIGFEEAIPGIVFSSPKTNGQGIFSSSLQTGSKPISLQVKSGQYLEEASLKAVTLNGDIGLMLRSVDYYQAGDTVNLSATFFTTLATGLTEYLVKEEGLSTEVAIEQAYAEIDAWAGFDTRRTQPVAAYDVANASPFLTDPIKAGFVAGGISELTRVVGVDSGNGEHSVQTSIGFIALAYEDIKADGLLDGQGSSGQLMFGNLSITNNTYRTLLSTRMLQFLNSDKNQIGLGFDDVLDYASELNLYAGELFNFQAAVDIKETYPTVTQFLPEEGDTISGGYTASALVADPFGLLSVTYYIDGQFAAGAGNPYLPFRTINTLNFTNGLHLIRIDVENFFGNIASVTHSITIQN